VLRLASVVDADRARLGAGGERLQEIGQLGIARLRHQALDVVAPAPAARLACEGERRPANVGQDRQAVSAIAPVSARTRPQLDVEALRSL
jgi:hypothetical protein